MRKLLDVVAFGGFFCMKCFLERKFPFLFGGYLGTQKWNCCKNLLNFNLVLAFLQQFHFCVKVLPPNRKKWLWLKLSFIESVIR